MRLHDLPADGQTYARALVFAGGMKPLENLKYAFGIGGVETNAIVSHADPPKSLRLAYIGYLHGIDVDELCGDRYKRIDAFPFVFYGI